MEIFYTGNNDAKCGIPTPLEWLVRDVSENLKRTLPVATALRSIQEPDGKTLYLKTLYTLAKGHGEIKVIRKLPLCWLTFIVLKDAMQALGGGERNP